MLNQIVLVGRLTKDINFNDEKYTTINLSIPRSFRNKNGVYETDYIPCILSEMVAKNASEYCKKGDVIGVKGRLESKDNKINVIAEKVTFLSSKKN
jgi:single-strand DNA-binding protein